MTPHRFPIDGERFYVLARGIRELRADEISPRGLERFARRLKRSTSGCLVYTGARNGNGYGVFRLGGKGSRIVLAHRLAFAIADGICPDDRVVGHVPALDHDRRCCDRAHLEATTPIENTPGIFEGRGRPYVGDRGRELAGEIPF